MRTGGGVIQHTINALWQRLGPCVPQITGLARRILMRGLAFLSHRGDSFHSPPVSKKSLRLRLSVFFTAFLVIAWLFTAITAWLECREYINEFFDTQQILFAQRLAEAGFAHDAAVLSMMGGVEDDALGFAVFTIAGDVVMADARNGRHFAFKPDKRGFSDERLAGGEGDIWRIVRLAAKDGGYIVAVGQEADYRQDMTLEMLGNQIIPWIVLLPVLLLGLIVLLGRELAPLRGMAKQLQARTPEDATPLDVTRIPSEVLPMAEALNGFFAKTNAMLTRERSFIADAAHELRTPLAGLRVQTQVAAQEGISKKIRGEALAFLLQGIDRCTRLVEQLLALSRLDAMNETVSPDAPFSGFSRGTVEWSFLLDELVREYRPKAAMKNVTLEYDSASASLNIATQGYPALISLLLRNLLDNAVRYSLPDGRIDIFFEGNGLIVENAAPELPPIYVSRLGERFFRPPGQEEPGSGLGLSIVKRIAAMHRFSLTVEMREKRAGNGECRFRVALVMDRVMR